MGADDMICGSDNGPTSNCFDNWSLVNIENEYFSPLSLLSYCHIYKIWHMGMCG